MMAELFDEEYLRESYNKANRKSAMEMGRAEGEAKGRADERNLIIEKMRKRGMSDEEIEEFFSD